jgi:hypothetical protein
MVDNEGKKVLHYLKFEIIENILFYFSRTNNFRQVIITFFKYSFTICLCIFQVEEASSDGNDKINYAYQDDYDDIPSSSRPEDTEEKTPDPSNVEANACAEVFMMMRRNDSRLYPHHNISYDNDERYDAPVSDNSTTM